MGSQSKPLQVANDMVVSMAYVLQADNELVDMTQEGETLQFIQGYGSIIPGLEQGIAEMQTDETRAITVLAKDAYGEYDYELIDDIPISEFPNEIPIEPGLEMEMESVDGEMLYGKIISVGKSRVKINFNHPLAGRDLDFEITILDIRPATPAELEQGFVA
jgi:FKBP-type peptidyl-prolyl cis-trans isomerase SlyD